MLLIRNLILVLFWLLVAVATFSPFSKLEPVKKPEALEE